MRKWPILVIGFGVICSACANGDAGSTSESAGEKSAATGANATPSPKAMTDEPVTTPERQPAGKTDPDASSQAVLAVFDEETPTLDSEVRGTLANHENCIVFQPADGSPDRLAVFPPGARLSASGSSIMLYDGELALNEMKVFSGGEQTEDLEERIVLPVKNRCPDGWISIKGARK